MIFSFQVLPVAFMHDALPFSKESHFSGATVSNYRDKNAAAILEFGHLRVSSCHPDYLLTFSKTVASLGFSKFSYIHTDLCWTDQTTLKEFKCQIKQFLKNN